MNLPLIAQYTARINLAEADLKRALLDGEDTTQLRALIRQSRLAIQAAQLVAHEEAARAAAASSAEDERRMSSINTRVAQRAAQLTVELLGGSA